MDTTMKQLTAHASPRSLREHAIAFWNYYNPSGEPSDVDAIELSETTINGILFTTLYEPTLAQETLHRRAQSIADLSQGAVPYQIAKKMLWRATGRSAIEMPYGKTFRSAGGVVENLLHRVDCQIGSKMLNRGLNDESKRARRMAAITSGTVTEQQLITEALARRSINAIQLLRLHSNLKNVREHRTGPTVKAIHVRSAENDELRAEIAQLLGYNKWVDLYFLFQTQLEIPILSTIEDPAERARVTADVAESIAKARRYQLPGDNVQKLMSPESRRLTDSLIRTIT